MAVHAENKLKEQTIWNVDTSRSNHMHGIKSSFTHLNKNLRSTISLVIFQSEPNGKG